MGGGGTTVRCFKTVVLGDPGAEVIAGESHKETPVFLKHALKNGITPAISYIGPMAAFLITGSIVVEYVFKIEGLGQHFIQSALNRDYGLVMGTVLLYSALIIVFNLAVDLMYSVLDPRVRIQ